MTIERARRGGRRKGRPALLFASVGLGLATLVLALLAAWLLYAQGRLLLTETLDRRAAAPSGGRWVHAWDTDVHVREWGPAGGKPLLLVHGTGAWAGTWASNVASLQAAGYRILAMDLPPFGFSVPPAGRDYSRQAQAQRILAVAAQLGPQVTLVGHSFGGGPASEAAMLEPGRFEHLVLVDAAIGLPAAGAPPCAPASGMAPSLAGWRGLRTLLVGAVGTEPAFSAHWLRQFVARQEVVTPARTAIYQQPFAARDFSEGLGDWAYQFGLGCERPASADRAAWRGLQLPVSLLWGDLDTITPLAQARELQSLLPRGRLSVLRGVGHIPQIEDVAAFDAALLRVLAERP